MDTVVYQSAVFCCCILSQKIFLKNFLNASYILDLQLFPTAMFLLLFINHLKLIQYMTNPTLFLSCRCPNLYCVGRPNKLCLCSVTKLHFDAIDLFSIKALGASATALSGAGAIISVAFYQTSQAADLELHPPNYPWEHSPMLSTLDMTRCRFNVIDSSRSVGACDAVETPSSRLYI